MSDPTGSGPLADDPDPIGVLTAISEADERRVLLASGPADVHRLRPRLTTNRDVATAVGILMERRRLDVDQALGVLVTVSQRSRSRLGAVAAELVESGAVLGFEALTGSRTRPG